MKYTIQKIVSIVETINSKCKEINKFVDDSTLNQSQISKIEQKINNLELLLNDINNQPNSYNCLTFTAEEANSTIKLIKEGQPVVDGLQYRLGTSGDWNTYSIDTQITLTNVGDKVQFQNTKNTLSTSDGIVQFEMTGKIAASGNIQSMLNYSESCSDYCYIRMFYGCTNLTVAPELPATTLADSCYERMFQECTSLIAAPDLPATTLAYWCYAGMFEGCTSLTTAPQLPATTLVDSCYVGMFRGCTSLTTAPSILPATTLTIRCYYSMFAYCSSLTVAPELPATTLARGCYDHMFAGCTSLNYIKTNHTLWNTVDTYNWVLNVSPTGTFIKPKVLPIEYGVKKIPEGWTVINIEDNPNIPLTFTAEETNSTIKLTKNGSPTINSLQYRLGTSGDWNTYSIDTVITLSNIGDKVQFQNTNNQLSINYSNYVQFVMTGKISASGNMQSILNYSESCRSYSYYRMFYECTSLTTAPVLLATTLADSCYEGMFEGCTSLTKAPAMLPATTLADSCYNSMFAGCASLTTAPELPATTLADRCYAYMFIGCTSLTKAPSILPATTLAQGCYNSMFGACTSLTTAPQLPASALDGYCYYEMFRECTSLNYIKTYLTSWKNISGDTTNWVDGVSSTGTFIKPKVLPIEYGISRIPEGWTVENF